MTVERFRGLMVTADDPKALAARRIQAAEARGRLTGLLLVRRISRE